MGVFNRRNAAVGFAAWKLGKRVVSRKVKSAPPKAKKRKPLVALLLAAGAGIATFLRLRRGGEE
ncbi:MAG: hypothetical protein JOY72_02615 [Actinobacteria bacterium]|nr:hypothetical protein [Actinomycetota bacterium]